MCNMSCLLRNISGFNLCTSRATVDYLGTDVGDGEIWPRVTSKLSCGGQVLQTFNIPIPVMCNLSPVDAQEAP